MQDLQTVSSDIVTTVRLFLHFCECIIHFADKCMYLHSQSVLALVLLGALVRNTLLK